MPGRCGSALRSESPGTGLPPDARREKREGGRARKESERGECLWLGRARELEREEDSEVGISTVPDGVLSC